jgi:hypothetical protein
MNERSIFMEALEKDTLAGRSAYLDEACGGNAAMRQRVEALLVSHEQAGSFLGKPVPQRLAEKLATPERAAGTSGEPPGADGDNPSLARGPLATVDEPAVTERPGTVIGPYKLLQQIGEGGMGTVFMAEQTQPVQRRVALKIIKPGMDSRQVIARFEAERQAVALMDHPNIAKVFDAGTTEAGRPYFVMELVHGLPITRYCDDNHLTPKEPAVFIALLETVRDGRMAQLGPCHPDTLTSQTNLAVAYLIAGRSADGIGLLERVRDTATKQLGPDDLHTLIALFALGIGHTRAGRTAEGIALFEIVRDAAERTLPPEHPYAQDALSGLAMAYQTAGRTVEAIPLLEKVRDAQVAKLGPNHRRTLITLSALAEAYRAAGRTAEYLASLDNLRHANEAKLGPDHQDTLVALNELATAYRVAGKLDQALPLFQQAADRAVKKVGLTDPSARKYLRDLGDCYERLSQFDKAEPLQRELAAFTRDKAGATRNEYSRDLSNLGLTLLRQKKFPEAERTFRECLALREKNQPNLWVRYNTLSQLGGSLLGQLKYADTEPLLLTGYQGMKEREVQVGRYDQVRLSEAVDRLIDLYTALGKQEEAEKWRAERKKYAGGPEYGEGPAERRGAPPPPK